MPHQVGIRGQDLFNVGNTAEPLYSPRVLAERRIAVARVALAACSLLAIWLDPSEPTNQADLAYGLLAAYLGYSALCLSAVWFSQLKLNMIGMTTHAIDLAAFTAFAYFTSGSTSPFFVYFLFALLCAALRWRKSGALWTAAAILILFTGQGVITGLVSKNGEFDLNVVIIRSAYVAIAALLLAYLTDYEERVRKDLTRLAAWPVRTEQNSRFEDLVREMLGYAADVLCVPRILMIWKESEASCRRLAWRSEETFGSVEEACGELGPPVIQAVAHDFLCMNAAEPDAQGLHVTADGFRRRVGPPLHPDFVDRFVVREVVAVALGGEQFDGWLLFLDKSGQTSDDLVLGGIVGRQVTVILNQYYLYRRLQSSAALDERSRMSRDLHDGVLQSLTGIALRLETVPRLLEIDPGRVEPQIRQIQAIIAEEQRGLRKFIQKLKSMDANPGLEIERSDQQLLRLAERIGQQWGIRVEFTMDRSLNGLPESLNREILFLVSESLINAARHARASLVRVSVCAGENNVLITVADDGQGFPFQGCYNLNELSAQRLGPESLKERITALGGGLNIVSTGSGARLEINLPISANRSSLGRSV